VPPYYTQRKAKIPKCLYTIKVQNLPTTMLPSQIGFAAAQSFLFFSYADDCRTPTDVPNNLVHMCLINK